MVEKIAEYGMRKTILIGQESFYIALPCKVSGTANSVIKAGMPLKGNIKKRDTAFVVSSKDGNDKVIANGLNLHDVQLDKDGNGNATLLLVGCVDELKLASDVVTKLGTVTDGLEHIVFVEGSAI